MKWTILNTLICPHTGVAFSSISGLRFLKVIIWYEADLLLLPGETMKLYSSKVLINDQYHSLKVYNITRYDDKQWETLRERPTCRTISTPRNRHLVFINRIVRLSAAQTSDYDRSYASNISRGAGKTLTVAENKKASRRKLFYQVIIIGHSGGV